MVWEAGVRGRMEKWIPAAELAPIAAVPMPASLSAAALGRLAGFAVRHCFMRPANSFEMAWQGTLGPAVPLQR